MPSQQQQMLESPRLAALHKALTAGDTAALETFWQAISADGAPLMEPIEGDPAHSLLTFLWRAQIQPRNVVVWGGPAGSDHPEQNQMARLPDTDLWSKTYRVPSDVRGVYSLSVNDPLTDAQDPSIDPTARFLLDPLNPRPFYQGEALAAIWGVGRTIFELPGASPQPWIAPAPPEAAGTIETHSVRSQILNNERRVWVYTPVGYTASREPYGLLVLFDGFDSLYTMLTPTMLDNLVRANKIPPLVAVLVDNPDRQARNRELPCHQPFVDFLTRELMPWVRARYHVTPDPARTIVGGTSYGGLAAAFVGLRASNTFGNVLALSGSFWWDVDAEENMQQEWLTQQFVDSPRLPLRFSLSVGLQEHWEWLNQVTAHRRLRDVLSLKGYEVHYAEANGYHHTVCWRASFPDRLMALTRGADDRLA
jgi:enterochelin esterase-like enzyme